MDLILALHVML